MHHDRYPLFKVFLVLWKSPTVYSFFSSSSLLATNDLFIISIIFPQNDIYWNHKMHSPFIYVFYFMHLNFLHVISGLECSFLFNTVSGYSSTYLPFCILKDILVFPKLDNYEENCCRHPLCRLLSETVLSESLGKFLRIWTVDHRVYF